MKPPQVLTLGVCETHTLFTYIYSSRLLFLYSYIPLSLPLSPPPYSIFPSFSHPLLPLFFLFFLSASPQDMYLQHCLSLEEYFNLRLHDLSLAAGRLVARHDLVDVSRLGMYIGIYPFNI